MRVFENGSLIIYNTQRTDAGYYLCQATNGIGPGISKVVKLTVHGKSPPPKSHRLPLDSAEPLIGRQHTL